MPKRIILGHLPDGTYGARVAKSGYDVTTNPVDPTQLIFDSNWPVALPVHQIGTFNMQNNSQANFTALTYFPLFLIFASPIKSSFSSISDSGSAAIETLPGWNSGSLFTTFDARYVKGQSTVYPYLDVFVSKSQVATSTAGAYAASFVIMYVIFKVGPS